MKNEMCLCVLVLIFIPLLMSTAYRESDSKWLERKCKPKLQKPYFAMSFSPEFASRFSLPKEKAIQLSDGLKAIAIEIRLEYGEYKIYWHLYVDSSLDLDFPNKCGDHQKQSLAQRFFLKSISKNDQKWRFDRFLKEGRRNMMQSRSLSEGKDGIVNSLDYYSVKQDFLPGLTLVTLYGQLSPFLDVKYGPAEILMQKAGMGDYLMIDDPHCSQCSRTCYQFHIPVKLQKHIDPFIRYIGDENYKNISEDREPEYDFI